MFCIPRFVLYIKIPPNGRFVNRFYCLLLCKPRNFKHCNLIFNYQFKKTDSSATPQNDTESCNLFSVILRSNATKDPFPLIINSQFSIFN